MNWKKAVLLLPVLYVCIDVSAQSVCTHSFAGQVLDENGNSIAGAAIVLKPGDIGTVTDANGTFKFDNLCEGDYGIRIQFIGYEEISTRVRIKEAVVRNFKLREQATELQEIVVEHHDAANTEHATHFTALDERQLAESAGKSLGESLREISGVSTLQTGPGIFKPVIHGMHSQRLLILNHGIRQEGQQWGAEHAPEIDPFIASNIVVIKDASAIKFGPGALGGVVVVNPPALPTTGDLAGTLSTILQSNGRSATVSGMIESAVEDTGWAWRAQGTAKRTGDFRTPRYSLTNTGVKELNFSASAGYHKEKVGFDLFFSRFQTEIGILRGTVIGNLDDLVTAMERDVPLYTSGFSYAINEPRQEVSHNLLKINGHVTGKAGEWRFQYGFQNNNRKEFDLRIGQLSEIPTVDLQLNTHSLDTEFEMHHADSRTMSFGVNTSYQSNKNIPGTQRIPFIPNFNNLSGGLYAISKFFLRSWDIDGGIRYDYRNYSVKGYDFKNTFYTSSFGFNNFSASLGIAHQISASQRASLNVSTAWRPPHVAELYSVGTHQSAAAIEYGLLLNDSTNEVMDIDDASFSTEYALKAVAAYQYQKGTFMLTISPYVNYISNYIYLRPEGITRKINGVSPYFRYRQTDALFLGTDVDASLALNRFVTLNGKASLLKARDVANDDYFVFIPSSRFSGSIRYTRPDIPGLKMFYVESKVQYVARQTFSPRVVTVREIKEGEENDFDPFEGDQSIFDFVAPPDGYILLNMAAGLSIKGEKTQYDFRIGCDNLLNTTYREYTNRFRYYADELGRNLTLSIECIF